ncbi:semialdehyde dehydrogenase [Salsipaludibacter albus]|uniref:semialdehyde dehydrogenase n=1 Tax=Salsipaludibacter albus TaxID=2849650 RepID=UPI001EE4EAFD|nr:semialdehyde dehydrogenase [Salsipaludibacter albus]
MKTFAFLVHPRAEVATDMARIWRPLGRVPDPAWEWAMRRLPLPPLPLGTVHRRDLDDRLVGHVLTVPVGARQMLSQRRAWTITKVEQAMDRAVALGAEVVGLGALTSPVTGGGARLRPRPGVGVTNGNAFTAAMTHEGIVRLLATTGLRSPHVALVGATGSVGDCVTELLAHDDLAARYTLVARNRGRLADLADRVRVAAPGARVDTSTDVAAIRSADLVVVLTSAASAVVRSEHLKPGAVVLDDTQPRNTDPALAHERPDVLVVDGGMARIDGIDIRADIGVPEGYAYACLCETMLLAFADHDGDFCVGRATPAQARTMQGLAADFGHLGFRLGDFLSFGAPATHARLGHHVEPSIGHDRALRPAPAQTSAPALAGVA